MTRPPPTSRIHRHVLGLTGPPISRDDADAEGPQVILLHRSARSMLRAQLQAPGVVRGGLLLGFFREGALHVLYAAPQGYRWWDLASPLTLDPRYALGWADALAAASSHPLDWLGSWVMYADSEVGPVEQDLRWLGAGRAAGILDDRAVLLSVGWQDGRLASTGYRLLGQEVQTLPVEALNERETGSGSAEGP